MPPRDCTLITRNTEVIHTGGQTRTKSTRVKISPHWVIILFHPKFEGKILQSLDIKINRVGTSQKKKKNKWYHTLLQQRF